MPHTLQALNAASLEEASRMLDGLYEHSPWIAQAALAERPFQSLVQLKMAMARVLDAAGAEKQVALVRAHPELASEMAALRSLREPQLWPPDIPLRAGVNSMGFGGHNVALVIKSARDTA